MNATPLESSTHLRAQCRRLSGKLTPVFKFAFPGVIITIGVICTFPGLRQRPQMSPPWLAFTWMILLLIAYWYARLKKVVAYPDHLVVGNYITETCVPYDEIDEVRVRRERGPVFVRLRLRTACRFGRTIHFLLPSTISRIESQPVVELLRQKCPQLCDRSGIWWLATLYLRPRAIRAAGRADNEGLANGKVKPTNAY
jgi:hypothetical protein